MLVLHGAAMATCTGRVLTCFFQMGLVQDKDFKLVSVTDFAEIKSAEWLAHHPFGQMPWLEDTDNGIEMYESRAIIKYAAAKFGSPLMPVATDLKAYAGFEKACSIELCNFDEPAHIIVGELIGARKEPDVTLAEKCKALLAKRLAVYDQILGKQKYIAGDSLTLADLFHLTFGGLVNSIGGAPALTDAEGHPNLARWWKELVSLPSWASYQAILAPAN